MLNVVMAFSIALLASPQPPAARNAAPLPPIAELASPLDETARVYDELRSMPARERTQALAQLPASRQAAVWARHLLTTLVEHPEFTLEQRAVLQDALSLVTPELFAIDAKDPRWGEAVDRPLRQLQERAVATFPDKAFVRDLFTRLGPEVPAGSGSTPPGTRPSRVITNAGDCTCNPNSDWCGYGQECGYTWCVRTETRGCGTMLMYPCLGVCFLKGWP